MLQAIVKKGHVFAEEVPTPVVSKGSVLIKVVNSCISAGTELSGISSSGESLIKKALKQPEKVAKILNMARTEGLMRTWAKVQGKLESGSATGYSISGIVIAVGQGITGFHVNDRVAAAGAGLANHAEYVDVPENLVMRLPDGLDFKEASTVTLGGIALQGVRRADLRLGEFCVVLGTGILGLLAVQLLKQSGVRVAAIDTDSRRLGIVGKFCAELTCNPTEDNVVDEILNWTGGHGADCVLFTASTLDNEPLSQAFQMCRRKGRVILVGVSGMNINREDIYPKELDFQISTSYGPGRYDRKYEEKGLDYPYSYVRWTENRNMAEYLRLCCDRSINLTPLIEEVYPIEKTEQAFACFNANQKPLMVILDYGQTVTACAGGQTIRINSFKRSGKINVALIGAGGFATGMHLPNLEKLTNKYKLRSVLSRKGYDAKSTAMKHGAEYCTTDYNSILSDNEVDLVMICTRHDSHETLVLDALNAGKNVFVEKPLAVSFEGLKKIENFYSDNENAPLLFVGFNRRFSRYAREIKKHTDARQNPLFIQYGMNAGYLPADHWVHDDGGRIVGEACHIIDLMTFFTNARIQSVSFEELTGGNGKFASTDNKSLVLKYEDGSVANIQYFSVGNKSFPKEQMILHYDNKTIEMVDYKKLNGYGLKMQPISTSVSEKGQLEELHCLHDSLTGKSSQWPIELWDMIQTTEICLRIANCPCAE